MTTNEGFDRRLSTWLERDAVGHVPDHLDEVLLRTAATRQRPWWSSPERWLPMDLTSRATTFGPPRLGRLLVLAVLIALLAAAALLAVGTQRTRVPPPFGPAAHAGSRGDRVRYAETTTTQTWCNTLEFTSVSRSFGYQFLRGGQGLARVRRATVAGRNVQILH